MDRLAGILFGVLLGVCCSLSVVTYLSSMQCVTKTELATRDRVINTQGQTLRQLLAAEQEEK